MYAIVESGGKQYKVSPGQLIKVESLGKETGADVTIERVLMICRDDKGVYGAPYIDGAKVIASVEGNDKARKVIIFKQRPRKVYRKLNGHRQQFTALRIKEIVYGG